MKKSSKPKSRGRRFGIPKSIISSNGQPIHRIKRYRMLSPVALAAAAVTSDGYSFQLDELSNSSEFTSLFDLYRLTKVEVEWSATANAQGYSASSVSIIPRIATVIDYNSSGTFATFDDAAEFETCRIQPLVTGENRSKRVINGPRFVGVARDSTPASVAATSQTGWLNTSSPSIPHYGFRWIAEAAGSNTVSVLFTFVYHLELKAVK